MDMNYDAYFYYIIIILKKLCLVCFDLFFFLNRIQTAAEKNI